MQFDIKEILYSKYPKELSDEEWEFLNSVDFDLLFQVENPMSASFKLLRIMRDALSGIRYFTITKLKLVDITYGNPTNKFWNIIKWAISYRFNDIVILVDELLDSLQESNFEKKNQILNIFSLIPISNYGIMISLSKDPSKLFQFMDIFSKVRT